MFVGDVCYSFMVFCYSIVVFCLFFLSCNAVWVSNKMRRFSLLLDTGRVSGGGGECDGIMLGVRLHGVK